MASVVDAEGRLGGDSLLPAGDVRMSRAFRLIGPVKMMPALGAEAVVAARNREAH